MQPVLAGDGGAAQEDEERQEDGSDHNFRPSATTSTAIISRPIVNRSPPNARKSPRPMSTRPMTNSASRISMHLPFRGTDVH